MKTRSAGCPASNSEEPSRESALPSPVEQQSARQIANFGFPHPREAGSRVRESAPRRPSSPS
jgi:hypothetical protein